ncbi:MAG: SAM-dependent methyltransferase [Gaiellaceae bacterium]
MPFQELMGLTSRLLVDAQALAAITARLRLDDLGVEGDPAVRAQLDRVVEVVGAREDVEALNEGERPIVLSIARSYLTQALDLIEHPEDAGAWSNSDPVLLRAQGSASAAVAGLFAAAGLGSDGVRILDVGTGVGGLAIAFCKTFPGATVVGVDPWEPALAIARENVAAAGLEPRIALVSARIEELDDPDGFDLTWLPSFFIPEHVFAAAVERIFALTRPGGTLVVGTRRTYEDDPLAAAVDDLFTVRSGGSALAPQDAVARLEAAGFESPHEVEGSWHAPLGLVAGRRP